MATEPDLIRIAFDVCELCLTGAGGECHAPGCTFWMNDAPIGSDIAWLRERRAEEVGADLTPPTRDQVRAALDKALEIIGAPRLDWAADAVMALLSGQSPTEVGLCAQCGQRPETSGTGLCDECWEGEM